MTTMMKSKKFRQPCNFPVVRLCKSLAFGNMHPSTSDGQLNTPDSSQLLLSLLKNCICARTRCAVGPWPNWKNTKSTVSWSWFVPTTTAINPKFITQSHCLSCPQHHVLSVITWWRTLERCWDVTKKRCNCWWICIFFWVIVMLLLLLKLKVKVVAEHALSKTHRIAPGSGDC